MADHSVYKSLEDTTLQYKYLGEAIPGTLTSDQRWRILRITLADNTMLWAESGEFQVAWDNRATVSYT